MALQNELEGFGPITNNFKTLSDAKKNYEAGNITLDQFLKIGESVIPETNAWLQANSSGQERERMLDQLGRSGYYDASKDYTMYKMARQYMGRDLTPSEKAQLAPSFQGDNWQVTGPAALSQFADAYKKTPEYLKTQAPQYSGDVNQVFNDLLKRGATEGELQHFGQMLATGDTDLFELSQYVQSLPEFQTKADTEFRTGLADELQGYDTRFFQKASPEIMSQYAKAGIKNSSALDYAMTDLMGNIAAKRGEYLAGLSSSHYGGNKAAAREDYLGSMNAYLGNQNTERQRAWGLQDYYNQRGDQASDYERQMRDYMNYLNSQQKQKPGTWDYLNAGLNLANTGTNIFKGW